MEHIKKAIGERLKQAREKIGLKQNRAAAKLGIHNSTLAKYESGEREADNEVLIKLADLYEVSPQWLLTGEEHGTTISGRAYYGGGDNLSEAEKAAANKKINEIRDKIYIQHPDGFRVFITPDEEKYLMEQLKMYKAFKKQEDK